MPSALPNNVWFCRLIASNTCLNTPFIKMAATCILYIIDGKSKISYTFCAILGLLPVRVLGSPAFFA